MLLNAAKLGLLLLLLSPVSTYALIDLGIKGDMSKYAIGEGIEYLEDSSHKLTIDSILEKDLPSEISDKAIFNKGYSESTWWLRVPLKNGKHEREYLAEIAYSVLDYIDVWVIRNGQIGEHFVTGDKLPFYLRPVDHRFFVFPFNAKEQEELELIVKVRSSSAIQLPFTIWERNTYYSIDAGYNVVHGLYMGGLLSIAIYNFLIFFALKDNIYFYYVFYVVSMSLFIACLNGWSFQYLWPNSTTWNDISILISLNGVVFFGVNFIRTFLRLDKLHKHFTITANVWTFLSGASFFVFMSIPYSLGIKIIIPFAAIICFWGLYAGIYSWFKGQQSAGLYVIAWGGILVGGIILALNKLEFLPRNLVTDYATQLGALIEVLLLSFALAERINHEKAMRLSAQEEALTLQKRTNEELEARVAERTTDLEIANKKLQELSDTDQLTSLKNRRYLDLFLEKELSRAQRYQHTFSVLLIDIDHFKSVNDNYGHLVGDVCIKEVAKRINNQLRGDTDLCARYGGEEFCMVLPETSREGAIVVAERARSSVSKSKISSADFDKTITVSIGVYSAVPQSGDCYKSFLSKADEALYRAKQNGRDRVEPF